MVHIYSTQYFPPLPLYLIGTSTALADGTSNFGNKLKPKPKQFVWQSLSSPTHLRHHPLRHHPPARPSAMPLFTNHAMMNVNACRVRCPEVGCELYLPAPKKCLNSKNKDRYYTACYNPSHSHMFKFWDLGVTPTPAANHPSAASLPQPPPFPMPAPRALRTVCPTCGHQGNALCRTDRCKTDCRTHSTVLCKVHNTLQPPAAQLAVQPSVPRPPPKEDRDCDMAIKLALGSSPRPHTTLRQTHHITVLCWLSSGPGRTTVVQDQPGWETTWPRIRLDDLILFLTLSTHPCPDQYHDYWTFSLGVWLAIPLTYDFTVLTDEPILICRSWTFAANQAEMVAAFSHLVKRCARKHIKVKHEVSDDEIEVSAVCKVVKLEPHMPPAYCYPPTRHFPALCLAGGVDLTIPFSSLSLLLHGQHRHLLLIACLPRLVVNVPYFFC
ncbi:hypothetical protein B0H14DRAFT_2570615 [Mycena olivaceomarginata]|nr:hypothetical protein B0H14DRAFT_2570615 [Mycena olivaceomarginata]